MGGTSSLWDSEVLDDNIGSASGYWKENALVTAERENWDMASPANDQGSLLLKKQLMGEHIRLA